MIPSSSMTVISRFFFALAFLTPLVATAKEPSPESVEKLLEASQAQNVNAGQIAKISEMIDLMINEAASKYKLTPDQIAELKKRLPELSKDLQKIVREEMGWPKVKESYAAVYARNFSQEEVNGLIAFYQSSSGKAFLRKMPQVSEELSQASLGRLPGVQERIQKSTSEMFKKLPGTAQKK
jgi:hypothetical protein